MTGEEFNWVKAREECSVIKAFLHLRHGVEEDLQNIKALSKGSGRVFDFTQQGESFTVFEGVRPIRTVTFSMDESRTRILIEQDNGDGRSPATLSVALTLNKEKQCRFLLGEEELEGWQLRKKALERLFFSRPVLGAAGFHSAG